MDVASGSALGPWSDFVSDSERRFHDHHLPFMPKHIGHLAQQAFGLALP